MFDPIRDEEGLFTWQNGEVLLEEIQVDDDTAQDRMLQQLSQIQHLQKWHQRMKVMLAAMVLFFFSAIGWWVVLPLVIHK